MRLLLSVSDSPFRNARQCFLAALLCLVIPDGFASSTINAVPIQPVFTPDAPCSRASEERLLMQGFAEDWQLLQACENPHSLWWVLDIKPKKKRMRRNGKLVNSSGNNDVIFEFESDFITRLERVTVEKYTGPPKWMPPNLAYWDTYIGDWRYLRTNLNSRIYEQSAGSELLMFWVKYEHSDDGILWDTSFDFSRLMEVFDVSLFRLNGLSSRVLKLLQLNEK